MPVIADVMASRWAYEALAVRMYKNNAYESPYFDLDKEASKANYVTTYVVPELNEQIKALEEQSKDGEKVPDMLLIRNIISSQSYQGELANTDFDSLLKANNSDDKLIAVLKNYSYELEQHNFELYNFNTQRKDKLIAFLSKSDDYSLNAYKMKYHNQSLEDLVRKINAMNRAEVHNHELIQNIDPIYNDNFSTNGKLNYRAQFYAPVKPLMNRQFDTFWFNFVVIWLMTIVLYIALYFEWLSKLIKLFSGIEINKKLLKKTKK